MQRFLKYHLVIHRRTSGYANCNKMHVCIGTEIDIDNSVTETSFDTKTTANCLEKSSQPCSCTWTWVDGIHDEVVSTDAALTPSKIGWYKCEVERYIRGRQCTMLAKLVHISEQTSKKHIY